MDEIVFLYTTWPDAETAEAAAVVAVERHLAACANILAPMRSIYLWDGALERQSETAMILKTTAAAAPRLRALVASLHPYETPCMVVIPIDARASEPAYVAWIVQQAAMGASPDGR